MKLRQMISDKFKKIYLLYSAEEIYCLAKDFYFVELFFFIFKGSFAFFSYLFHRVKIKLKLGRTENVDPVLFKSKGGDHRASGCVYRKLGCVNVALNALGHRDWHRLRARRGIRWGIGEGSVGLFKDRKLVLGCIHSLHGTPSDKGSEPFGAFLA